MSTEDTNQNNQYQRAYQEWSDRIGSARTQARNWRLGFILSVIALVLLVICLMMVLAMQKRYVYVAQIEPRANIVNLRTVDAVYEPTNAQSEYMIGRFIRALMALPLDPVVARDNWLYAYSLVQGQADQQLNTYFQTKNPIGDLGHSTKTVEIQTFHPISKNSYSFTWTQTQYDSQGKVENVTLYNGIFTIATGFTPKTTDQLLTNPFGVKIVYFSFSSEG